MNKRLPMIGQRIIKSAVAVLICFLIDYLRDGNGIVFYSQLSALWCIQAYRGNTIGNAIQRLSGTVIGAVYGLVVLLTSKYIYYAEGGYDFTTAILVSAMIILVLYTTVLLKKKKSSYFSCVVFLSIVVNHIGDADPYVFVFNRFLDTALGIIIGIAVNDFTLHLKKQRNVLFVSTMDKTLTNSKEQMSDYTKAMLNRMIDDGMMFTLATMRTPAVICEAFRDVRLRLPVIAMDGAVLYDINEKKYLKSYVISASKASQLRKVFEKGNYTYFTNIVIDDTLLIYHSEKLTPVQQKMIGDLRKSIYRNFICRMVPEDEDVVYFMLLDEHGKMQALYEELKASDLFSGLKIVLYESEDYEGCSYIKIFNHNASMENMIAYLKQMLNVDKHFAFGTIEGKYDCLISGDNLNEAAHVINKAFRNL